MPILPVKKIPAVQEFAYSTCGTISKGTALSMSAAGFLTSTLSNYATGVALAGVAAEPKATAASLLQSNKIRIWPANTTTTWTATVSGTASSVGIGSVCHLKNAGTGVIYSATAVATGGSFVIEGFTDSNMTTAYGKLIPTLVTGRRMPNKQGTT